MSINIARKLKLHPALTLEEYQAVLNVMSPDARRAELDNYYALFSGPAQWNSMRPEIRDDYRAKGDLLRSIVAAQA